jgi:glycerophosphoryl diester phosphodiesterase
MRTLSTTPHPQLRAPGSPPLVYAHRGGAALRPENTIAAFDHGLSFGADGIEFDVHLSRDGVVVVHHDTTLERTTSGRGRVSDFTADELARVDAGHWFQPAGEGGYPFRGRGEGIPRLQTVLERYPGVLLIIELKENNRELAHRVIDALRAAKSVDRAALGSFYWRGLHAAREYEPRISTGASQEETRWALYRSRLRWPIRNTAYRELQVPERAGRTTVVSPAFIAHAHRAGLPVKIWTVNERADMTRLISWGADAIISDRPDVAVDVVRAMPA